jgi:hypothetical protein
MHVHHCDFVCSPAMRVSLKRGLARQAMDHAERCEADLSAIFTLARDLRPNCKAIDRMAARMVKKAGVVQVARSAEGLVLVLRNVRHLVNTVDGVNAFSETALLYTRLHIKPGRLGPALFLNRGSFCRHAMERFVERSQVALNRPLLQTIDAEAVRLLRNHASGRMIDDAGDSLIRAVAPGVWAGGVDQMPPEDGWGLTLCDGAIRLPVFSVRTFLGATQMRPTLWLKWNDDPMMQMAA